MKDFSVTMAARNLLEAAFNYASGNCLILVRCFSFARFFQFALNSNEELYAEIRDKVSPKHN